MRMRDTPFILVQCSKKNRFSFFFIHVERDSRSAAEIDADMQIYSNAPSPFSVPRLCSLRPSLTPCCFEVTTGPLGRVRDSLGQISNLTFES